MRTAIGIFPQERVSAVIHDLMSSGLSPSEITLVAQDAGAGRSRPADVQAELSDLHVVKLPGIGEVVARGPLVERAEGTASGGFTSTLTAAGIPENVAASYVESVKDGAALVAASVGDDQVDDTLRILTRHMQPGTELDTGAAGTRARPGASEVTLPVVEEELEIGRREVDRGGLRVRAYVTERPVEETVRLRDETVHVQRRAVDRPVDPTDPELFKEIVFELREVDEEAVVTKRARVVEEVVLTKETGEHEEKLRETLRREQVEVEPILPDRTKGYEEHFASTLAGTGHSYQQYLPAYRFGHGLKGRSAGSDWTSVEPNARREWETKNPGTWERVKEAVRHAWERATK